jgi:hypothetical protein
MSRQSPHRRRARIGLCGRAAAWLVAFALVMQGVVGAGAALGMWMEANGSGQMAQGHCTEHETPGKNQHSGHPSHDHEHCLLCTAVVGDCPTPVLPLLSAVLDESIVLATPAERVAYRKLVYANAARGPPARA